MSCRHDLANGTCPRCYPDNPGKRDLRDRIDPGPEEDYEPNLEGPGAVSLHEGWCAVHRDRLAAVDDARFVVEALITLFVLSAGKQPATTGCWACALTEPEFQELLREGATLVAKAEAFGGTYTAKGIALSLGAKKS